MSKNLRKITAAFTVTAALLLPACGAGADEQPNGRGNMTQGQEQSSPENTAPQVEVNKFFPKSDVPVKVSQSMFVLGDTSDSASGTITNLDTGKRFPLTIKDGEVTPSQPLAYGTKYKAQIAVTNKDGKRADNSVTFTTVRPDNLTMPYYNAESNEEVGVGFSIAVRFDEAIPDKKAAQESVTVEASDGTEVKPYWINEKELRLRPKEYWTPGTKVSVRTNIYGVDLGQGLYGQKDSGTNFIVGERRVSIADDRNKILNTFVNNKKVRSMPTSMGKPGDLTQPGTYIVNDRREHMIMDSSTYGVASNSANGYVTPVDWATQISYSGIYVHSAPWSVWAQGNTNTSHGCLNLSPENAEWFLKTSRKGDIVKVLNTGAPTLSGTDGLGDWNTPWSQWAKGNA